MKATNIQWDVEINEVLEKLRDMKPEKAAEELEMPVNAYSAMSTSERDDYASDYFHHNPGAMQDFVNLPEEVEIPDEVGTNAEDISEWLSDEYGYCHEGFTLDPDDIITQAMNTGTEITSQLMSDLLMDDSWTTHKMYEDLASEYLAGNADVRKGIDKAVSALTGWNMKSIAERIIETAEEEVA